MPGSTTLFPATTNDEVAKKAQQTMMGTRQPPPVAPRTTSITLQTWQQATSGGDGNYIEERYARSASTDSLESSGSSSSGGGNANNRISDVAPVEYIPTRTTGKIQKLPSHNPLQFVKVHSPLYKKAEQQIKLTKEVKITREALKEGEEEWQSNLDNWKSRRRKVSEKVIQRAEEMRQIEAEEQLRQEQLLQQQKKIKKFSEIVEKKSTRSYNLELYIGQGNDSGLGGTPEPDDTLDCQSSLLRSDTSEGMTSEAESVDSDIHKSDKVVEKEPPKVPQKPYSRFKKSVSVCYDDSEINSNELFQNCLSRNDLTVADNASSTEPSDVEGHAADTEATSSEEDAMFSGQLGNTDSGLESLGDNRRGDLADSASDLSQDSSTGLEKNSEKLNLDDLTSDELEEDKKSSIETSKNSQISDGCNQILRLCIKPGDNKGFGFTLKGGKDQGCSACIENVVKGGLADEMGLKDGDKIISLNGELTADYSHASLIFSVKQAAYTGILDIVINRSENSGTLNPEVKPRESRKGKSFAEKLAIFSAGITIPTSIEEPKSNTKLVDSKRESLVLRRRSAFENGKTESVNILNRRSSCVPNSANVAHDKVLEKRHSADFTVTQNVVSENNFIKKSTPPPVPVKPKIKSKPVFSEVNKSTVKTNGISEKSLSPDSISNGAESPSFKFKIDNEELAIRENNFFQENEHLNFKNQHSPVDINKVNPVDNFPTEESISQPEINETANVDSPTDDQKYLINDLPNPDESTNFDQVGENITDKILTSFEANEDVEQTQEIANDEKTLFEVTDETSYSFYDKVDDFCKDTQESIFDDSNEQESESKSFEETCSKAEIFEETSLNDSVQISAECAIEPSDENIDNCLESDTLYENDVNSVSSACRSTCDNEDYSNISQNEECIDVPDTEDSETLEIKSNSQANASPLCLSLEKIDEDDVISASTTTSSDTPDTETVIETLPSNVSPLPNDESNGEDSSKILNGQDEESDQPLEASKIDEMSSTETRADEEIVQDYIDIDTDPNQEVETQVDEVDQTCETSVSDNVNEDLDDKKYFDEQDDEYAQELEESLDQITSLDIIDRIEQSLMDQLQKDDIFEDMEANLNSQLERDIDNPWLYYSEESELLDDLTPRNLEPPREPPPPPPPEEIECNDNKIKSISRTNSTKRIKKEIWRRRSDFLGIESSEGIDVDNIPPPPPGLEELLKQEREQTQWLEKRLSLVEPEIDISSYSTESTCLDSGNYSTNDYSDYFINDTGEPVKESAMDSELQQWKENMEDDNIFETTYGVQYESAPETLSTVIEEPVKVTESPQHKAKQNIHNLGAAPKAKIMDSTKWITEQVTTVSKKSVEPVFRQTSYNQNYWLAQDGERRKSLQYSDSHVDPRYSMSPVYSNTQPDVTVRTWGDREYEFQQHRPRSAIYERSGSSDNMYDQYINIEKKDLLRTQSLDSHRDVTYDTDTLESEVHNCSCCGKGLCEGSAMGIEALRLYFHIECFRCCVCHLQLGNGSCGTDVQVKSNQLYCPACFTVD